MENKIQLASIMSAEVDLAISTAKKYPRDIQKVIKTVNYLATLDQETAASCFYALPRAGKTIEGESIRFAEIVLQTWGNLKAATRIIGIDQNKITAQAVVFDLENNVLISKEVDRKITGKDGKQYSEDMIIVTGNAAASIALRNAIFQVVPKGLFKKTTELIKEAALGKANEFNQIKEKTLKWFYNLNVTEPQILSVLEIKTLSELTNEKLTELIGLQTAIKDGQTTILEVFKTVNGVSQTETGKVICTDKIFASIKKNLAIELPQTDFKTVEKLQKVELTTEQKSEIDELIFKILKEKPELANSVLELYESAELTSYFSSNE